MFISLQQLELRNVPFELDLPPGQIDFDGKLTQLSNLRAEGTASLLNRSLGEIRVQGKLQVEAGAVCDRCLEPAHLIFQRPFDLAYVPAAEAAAEGEKEIDEAAIEVGFYDGPGLELNDALREVIMLSLPMRIVCGEECKGICPVCGNNRNQRECGCQTKAADDRWNSLKNLRAEMAREGIRK